MSSDFVPPPRFASADRGVFFTKNSNVYILLREQVFLFTAPADSGSAGRHNVAKGEGVLVMRSGSWTEARAGTFNTAIQRLTNALGSRGEAVLAMMSLKPEFVKDIANFAVSRMTWHTDTPRDRIWMTVKIGAGPKTVTVADLHIVLGVFGVEIVESARSLLGSSDFRMSETDDEVDLVVITPRDLGFNDGDTYENVCERAISLGLELCPEELGPRLCVVQRTFQCENFTVAVAMKPIKALCGRQRIFGVEYCGSRARLLTFFRGDDTPNPSLWGPDASIVFKRPRK